MDVETAPALRVFVIEGERPLQNLLVWGLRQEGVDAVSAPDPEMATGDYNGRGGHLVVINADAPQKTRARWIDTIRVSSPGVAVIDLPRDGDASTNADAILPSPYRMERLLRLIRSLARYD